MKYSRMKEWRRQYPITVMCRVFNVSESGYHAWRDRPLSRRAEENGRLEIEIRAAHQRTRETCGPQRLQCDLADQGIRAGVPHQTHSQETRHPLQTETQFQGDHRFQA